MRCIFVPLTLLMLLLASAPAAPIPTHAKKTPLYQPLKVGTKLVYGYEGKKEEFDEVVMKVETNEGVWDVTLGSEGVGIIVPHKIYSVSDKGLCIKAAWCDGTLTPFDEPVWVLKLPHAAHDAWDTVFAISDLDLKYTGKTIIDGYERVKVPAGTFDAIRMKMDIVIEGERRQFTTWYAPHVGRVKEVLEDEIEVLKSYTPGDD